MTTVVVADDPERVRAGFAMILEWAGLAVVGQAADRVEVSSDMVPLSFTLRSGLVDVHA